MSSPLFDALHLKLARKIADPVAAAATNGDEADSSDRTDYLNRANDFIRTMIYMKSLDNPDLAGRFLSGLFRAKSLAFTSGFAQVPSDVVFIVTVQKSTGERLRWVNPARKPELDQNSDPNETAAFTVMGATLLSLTSTFVFAYFNGVVIPDGTHGIYYIAKDNRASAGDTDDILIDPIWHETLVSLGASYHWQDKQEYEKANACLQEAVILIKTIMG